MRLAGMRMGRAVWRVSKTVLRKENRELRKAKIILLKLYCALMKNRCKTVEDLENLSRKGIRPILHNGQVAGWEVQSGRT